MKIISAIVIALFMTTGIGAAMFAVGSNALFNKNSVPTLNSPGAAAVAAANESGDLQQVARLQGLVSQYQSREKQYQDQLNQAAQELSQANQQIQQYQQLIAELQNLGVIRITNDGQVLIRGGTGN